MNRQLATRVMRARRTTTCRACHGPILVGQQIAKTSYWQHVTCLIASRDGHDRDQPAGNGDQTA